MGSRRAHAYAQPVPGNRGVPAEQQTHTARAHEPHEPHEQHRDGADVPRDGSSGSLKRHHVSSSGTQTQESQATVSVGVQVATLKGGRSSEAVAAQAQIKKTHVQLHEERLAADGARLKFQQYVEFGARPVSLAPYPLTSLNIDWTECVKQ